MVKLTKAQRKALFKLFQRDWPSHITPTRRLGNPPRELPIMRTSSIMYRRFRKQVRPYFDGSGCVIVPWCGMWVGIEVDGYAHS